MELTGIFVYPVKAMAGIALNNVNLEERGMKLDRRWMLIDQNNRFICQRQIPQLALFTLEIQESCLKVFWQEQSIIIPFDESTYTSQTKASVWDDKIDVRIATDSINTWFSQRLDIQCRLAYQGENSIRLTSSAYAPIREVSFADGYPYLMISEESLDLLNQKLSTPIEMNRFRANLIIKGGTPHIEDDFKYFKIGGALFNAVKPCARCKVITINQSNLAEGVEPLKTLSTYRKSKRKVVFGQNLVLVEPVGSNIKIGDKVEALQKKIQDN
jgi:MOSC domain-containing protein